MEEAAASEGKAESGAVAAQGKTQGNQGKGGGADGGDGGAAQVGGGSRLLLVQRSRVLMFVPGCGVRPFLFPTVCDGGVEQAEVYQHAYWAAAVAPTPARRQPHAHWRGDKLGSPRRPSEGG